jgi:hypothetical protein
MGILVRYSARPMCQTRLRARYGLVREGFKPGVGPEKRLKT